MANENLDQQKNGAKNAAKQSASPYRNVHVDRIDPPVGRRTRPMPHPNEGGYRDGIFQPDGDVPFHYLPDEPIEQAALRHTLGPRADVPIHRYPLGDLIVMALTGRNPTGEQHEWPAEWQTFEGAVLRLLAAEIRALAVAASQRYPDEDEEGFEEFTEGDRQLMMAGLARRCDAAAELAGRFRQARWGHPSFGGYDAAEAEALETSEVKS